MLFNDVGRPYSAHNLFEIEMNVLCWTLLYVRLALEVLARLWDLHPLGPHDFPVTI